MSPTRAIAYLLFFSIVGCTSSQSPRPIAFGHEACGHCKMVITDRRFGGEIVTVKGKVYAFDSLECLQNFDRAHADETAGAKKYVVDSFESGSLVEMKDAYFAIGEGVQAPMGRAVFASKDPKNISNQMPKAKATRWEDLKGQL